MQLILLNFSFYLQHTNKKNCRLLSMHKKKTLIFFSILMAFITNLVTKCRGDEFDLDLEEIMVMEAIWLSIQVKFTTNCVRFSYDI